MSVTSTAKRTGSRLGVYAKEVSDPLRAEVATDAVYCIHSVDSAITGGRVLPLMSRIGARLYPLVTGTLGTVGSITHFILSSAKTATIDVPHSVLSRAFVAADCLLRLEMAVVKRGTMEAQKFAICGAAVAAEPVALAAERCSSLGADAAASAAHFGSVTAASAADRAARFGFRAALGTYRFWKHSMLSFMAFFLPRAESAEAHADLQPPSHEQEAGRGVCNRRPGSIARSLEQEQMD